MIQNKINIPKLRFKGVDGELDNKKLSDVFIFFRGKGISREDIIKDGVNKCIRYGELYTEYSEIIDNVKSKTNILEKDSLLSKKGDVLIPSSGETAIDISTVSCVKLDNILLGGDLNVMRPKDGQNGNFYSYYLSSAKKISIAKIAQGNSVVHLYSSHLKNLKINVPLFLEQQKIADFLQVTDSWIENLKQQKENLKEHKKGMMQKIFAQEIRFKDENGKEFPDWETKKIGDIGIISTSSVDKKIYDKQKIVSLLNYMDVYKRDHIFKNDDFQIISASESQIISANLKKGDILFTPSSETPDDIGHSAVVMEDLQDVLFSYHLVRLRPKKNILDYNFSAYVFKVFYFYKNLWRKAQGATRFTLSKDAFESSKIIIPTSLTEQQKIADFLTSIDKLLDSKQQQIAKAKEWKKGLMQGLFV